MRKQNRRKREQHNQKNTKQLFIQLLSEFSGHSQATIQRVWMTVQNPPGFRWAGTTNLPNLQVSTPSEIIY